MSADTNAGAGGPDDVLLALRTATAAVHDALERELDLLRPDLTLDEYATVLARMAAFYAPLERRIHGLPDLAAQVPALTARRKLPLLERDLRALAARGVAWSAGDHVPDALLPCVDAVPTALGCLYVLEGATLGGRVIAPHLARCLGLSATDGAAFHAGYGDATGRMWRGMQGALRAAGHGAARTAMIAAATTTFAGLAAWCAARQPTHPP
ncbi:MAG: biliverdin-producing heme oxygenase [Gammaproteobacteria bacterium]